MLDKIHSVLITWKVHCPEFLLEFYYVGIIYWMTTSITELNHQPLSLTQNLWYHTIQSPNHIFGSFWPCAVPIWVFSAQRIRCDRKGPKWITKHCNHSGNSRDVEAELETKTRPLFGMRSDSLLHKEILWKLKQDFSMFSSECYHHCEVKWSEVAQSCLTVCNPMDCSPQGFSVHGILQARILEWVPISFSRGSSRLRDQTPVSHIAGRHFNFWATQEAQPSHITD